MVKKLRETRPGWEVLFPYSDHWIYSHHRHAFAHTNGGSLVIFWPGQSMTHDKETHLLTCADVDSKHCRPALRRSIFRKKHVKCYGHSPGCSCLEPTPQSRKPHPLFTSLSAVICVCSPSRIDTVSYKPGFCNGWGFQSWPSRPAKAIAAMAAYGSDGFRVWDFDHFWSIHSQPRGTSLATAAAVKRSSAAAAGAASNHELSLLGLHNGIRWLILDATPQLQPVPVNWDFRGDTPPSNGCELSRIRCPNITPSP